MDDKELDAIVSCHVALKDLSNDSKKRIFRYLSDRYNLGDHIITKNGTSAVPPRESSNSHSKEEQAYYSKKVRHSKKRKKSSSNSIKSYSLITDLNLVPNGNESLQDFFSKYNATNNFERNVVILYYLKRILNLDNIGINHIYTCYKHLSLKVPLLGQSLRDTKNRKGWIDTANSDNLKVAVAGENFIEHEISHIK
ncbi:MAG TPA: hypothetical protein VKA34_14690 [Balneolales bacterium]|nr:hypothetical protein [Balneolales bacterium]